MMPKALLTMLVVLTLGAPLAQAADIVEGKPCVNCDRICAQVKSYKDDEGNDHWVWSCDNRHEDCNHPDCRCAYFPEAKGSFPEWQRLNPGRVRNRIVPNSGLTSVSGSGDSTTASLDAAVTDDTTAGFTT